MVMGDGMEREGNRLELLMMMMPLGAGIVS